MKRFILLLSLVLWLAPLALAENMPYTYRFPKADPEWGNAAAFSNLSPGFFQVMYQSKTGIVRIATYGIVGASMDKLRDPQLMMVFAFDQTPAASGRVEDGSQLANK